MGADKNSEHKVGFLMEAGCWKLRLLLQMITASAVQRSCVMEVLLIGFCNKKFALSKKVVKQHKN